MADRSDSSYESSLDPPSQFPLRFEAIEEGPGRRKRAPLDVLRTQVWVYVVMRRSGWTTYRLEREFHPDRIKRSGGKVVRPRLWDRYREGKMVVSDRAGRDNVIDRVEARFPGTARWIRSPLWTGLSQESLARATVIEGFKKLEPTTRRLVLTKRNLDGSSRRDAVPTFSAITPLGLIKRGSFDALAAAVLFVRWSEVIAREALRHEALAVYYALQPRLADHPYLQPFYPRLFSLIDYRCRRWIFFPHDLAQRFEAVLTWHGLREHVWHRGSAQALSHIADRAAASMNDIQKP